MKLLFQNLTEIKGGLSKKKVFRKLETKTKKIVIDFSDDTNEFENFINVYNILKKINISIPKVYEVYLKEKIIIMEDFGDNTFHKIFSEKNIYNLLKLAVDNLIVIQNSLVSSDTLTLRKYTFYDLQKEVSEFVEYYIPYKKVTNFPVFDFYTAWKNIYNSQNFDFSSFIHKDFEFINLILLRKKNLHLQCGIIDFQSAILGFKGWDLFSILENSRLNFTRKYNEDLIKYFYTNVSMNIDFDTFRNQYYLLNLGRQTRLLGRWIKLFNEGNKDYLNYVVPTQKRIFSCLTNIKDDKLKKIYEKYL